MTSHATTRLLLCWTCAYTIRWAAAVLLPTFQYSQGLDAAVVGTQSNMQSQAIVLVLPCLLCRLLKSLLERVATVQLMASNYPVL